MEAGQIVELAIDGSEQALLHLSTPSIMVNGPPPSAAESSGTAASANTQRYSTHIASTSTQSASAQPASTNFTSNTPGPSAPAAQYGSGVWPGVQWSGYATATVPYGSASVTNASNSGHYNPYLGYYPTPAGQQPHPLSYYPSAYENSMASNQQKPQTLKLTPKQEEPEIQIPPPAPPVLSTPTPIAPAPTLQDYKHWDTALRDFLEDCGLIETLRGFENDMLVMSPDWEQERIPRALEALVERLTGVAEYPRQSDDAMSVDDMHEQIPDRTSLERRKQMYLNLSAGEDIQTPTSINKSISRLLAKNRAKTNASNRSEFLYSKPQRQRNIEAATGTPPDAELIGSCARTDAKPIDRDEQMKYDIAKNNEGPLTRTIKAPQEAGRHDQSTTVYSLNVGQNESLLTAARYPSLEGRLKDIETHFAVRYVPSAPQTLLSRLKLLEEHIIKLEKEYPPWAALHFNQPNRGWPPPPRSTPIIVPLNMRSRDPTNPSAETLQPYSISQSPAGSTSAAAAPPIPSEILGDGTASAKVVVPSAGAGGKQRNNKSSLHRAVMERLQVQQAMEEISGRSTSSG